MSTSSSQMMSDTNCLKFDIYSDVDHDPCHNKQILVVAYRILSYSPKASVNVARNNSKLLKIANFFSNRGANQNRVCRVNKVPTSPTYNLSIG